MNIETTPCVMCGYTLLAMNSETQACTNCNAERELERIMDDGCAVVGDATERCEKTAMETYATSALPYPFPVDSEIYDH